MSWITDKVVGRQDGVETRYHFDPDTEKSFLSYHQDAADILERNAAFRADGQTDSAALGRKVAEIPAVVWMEWCRLKGVRVQDFMRWKAKEKRAFCAKFLNDPDYKHLRAVDGKI